MARIGTEQEPLTVEPDEPLHAPAEPVPAPQTQPEPQPETQPAPSR